MKSIYYALILAASTLNLVSCDSNGTDPASISPFDTISLSDNNVRNKIIVISDLHLGNDLTYSENVKHLPWLKQFLNEVRSSKTIQELVLGGDIFDEWYIPTRTDTYGDGTQADFIRKTVAANQDIFDVLNGIIQDGKIKLTYVPGNHDMGFSPENIDLALPGVNQARDANGKTAVGTYHPDGYPEIAIEHGHRYDFFSSMAPNANEADAPGAMLPPGYFFARIAANSFTDPTTKELATKVPAVALNDSSNAEQKTKYNYYMLWKTVMERLIYVKDNFSDPIIKTNVGKYTKTYSINDILPQNSIDGSIQMNLYNNLFTQANWDAREQYNNVTVMTDINQALVGSLNTAFLDGQASTQYFRNPISNVRLVVFGHSHIPMIQSSNNRDEEPCLYVNSGTWEDQKTRNGIPAVNQDTMKMDFVVIAPRSSSSRKLNVGLYKYRVGKHVLMDAKELEL